MEGRFASGTCKHKMHICTACKATYCSGECQSTTVAGMGVYSLVNLLSRHSNHVSYERIKEAGLCRFCEDKEKRPEFIKKFEKETGKFVQSWKMEDNGYCFRIGGVNFCGLDDLSEETFGKIMK